jgi:exodeoxyribonuclease VII small subunit
MPEVAPASPIAGTSPAPPGAAAPLTAATPLTPPGSAAAPAAPVDPAISTYAFDRALGELQQVVAQLEAGGLPLEASIALYERGVALHEHCARLLGDAELRVQRLVDTAGGPRAVDLRPDEDPQGN